MYYNSFQTDSFLQFLYERLLLLKELLTPEGAIFIRMDVNWGGYLKVICDEIFGVDCFINQFMVNRIRKNVTNQGRLNIPNAVDVILVYSKSPDFSYVNINKSTVENKPGYWRAMDSAEVRSNPERTIAGKTFQPPPGRHFTFNQERVDQMYAEGKIRLNPKTGKPEYYVEEKEYLTLDTNWTDIPGYTFSTGYPTENSEPLLKRVIDVASKSDALVLDCFVGSGTTCAIAQERGRRWIGCDINKGAVQTTSKRVQQIILEQIKENSEKKTQKTLAGGSLVSDYYSFGVYKVNDYDLQLLRTEAMQLAVDHVGIQRNKTDPFFDGTLGKALVKIIDFNHPLTLLDLQLIQDELGKRREENRNITVVCLGKETTVDPWIEDYNKKHPVNKISVIELRTDPKYGKFMTHQPISAKISIERKKAKAIVKITDFNSPSILERLAANSTLVKTKIADFRSMIDVVLMDTEYDGKMFKIQYSDVPEKKADLVKGSYELEIPAKKTRMAVKIIDMLGEEMIVTKEI
jgi:hypothetical protein